jgi:glutamine synthetase
MADYKTYEYIWLDGYKPESSMRSKVKATDASTPPDWSFDGSSTQQAEGGSSDCLLIPVQTYANPNGHETLLAGRMESQKNKETIIVELVQAML